MEKFTGADLTEICQRAAKIAIRENIMKVLAMPRRAAPRRTSLTCPSPRLSFHRRFFLHHLLSVTSSMMIKP